MRLINIIILFLISVSCFSQNKNILYKNYSIEKSDSIKETINSLEIYINSIKDDDFNKSNFWSKSSYFNNPSIDLLITNADAKGHKIVLLAVNRFDSKRDLIKIAFIKSESEKTNLYAIYNFLFNKKEHLFENIIDENAKKYNVYVDEKIKYLIYPEHIFDKINSDKMKNFNTEIAFFFEKDELYFTYFLCKNMFEYRKIRGYDFDFEMVAENQIGAETFPADNLIFSGNNSEFYPHELVHLYTYHYFNNINPIINEGIATYFGGSKGLDFKKHIAKLKKYLQSDEINLYDKLFDNNNQQYVLDDTTSLWYTIGAILCDIAIKKYGKTGLFELMNSGTTNEELLQSIEKIFGVKRDAFDSFVKNEINSYE